MRNLLRNSFVLSAGCRDARLTVCLHALQIHLHKDGKVRIFSRNCEERSDSFPDVADAVRSAADGENMHHIPTHA